MQEKGKGNKMINVTGCSRRRAVNKIQEWAWLQQPDVFTYVRFWRNDELVASGNHKRVVKKAKDFNAGSKIKIQCSQLAVVI